jgi:hypothetical protein
MTDRSFWYGRVDPGYGRYRYEMRLPVRIDLTDPHDLSDLAELAADDFHSNHDGWEASWPITFGIAATEDGPELARFEVDRDVEPVFSATAVAGVPEGHAPSISDEALDAAIEAALPELPHSSQRGLTYNKWKDGIDVDYVTPPARQFVRKVLSALGVGGNDGR